MQLALNAVHDPNLVNYSRYFVRELYDENDDLPLSKYSEIAAIYALGRQGIRYTLDPIGVEAVYAPQTMLQLIQQFGRWAEDCDSISIFTLSMLLALGHETRLVIAGFQSGAISYSHVFCEAKIPGVGFVVVDPSLGDKVFQMCADMVNAEYLTPQDVLLYHQNRGQ